VAWTERQRALLREMGIRVWAPAPAAAPAGAAVPAAGDAMALVPAEAPTPVPSHPAGHLTGHAPAPVSPAATLAELPAAPPAAETAVGAPPAQLVPATVAGLGWAELRAAVAACRACRLCEGRKQTVFGVGHAQAHWMVIGEAPGAQEDEQGEPFVGAAGQLLDAMLRALDLSRAAEGDAARRVFIANTLKCRPPGNRNPQPDEMAQCEPFLLRQIELVRPRLILAMGRFAVQALLRTTEPIGRLRGKVHRYQGAPLVVTYHPAYLLRNLPDKARAWEDLCLAADIAESVASVEGATPAR
jgi:DNA polymerase